MFDLMAENVRLLRVYHILSNNQTFIDIFLTEMCKSTK